MSIAVLDFESEMNQLWNIMNLGWSCDEIPDFETFPFIHVFWYTSFE